MAIPSTSRRPSPPTPTWRRGHHPALTRPGGSSPAPVPAATTTCGRKVGRVYSNVYDDMFDTRCGPRQQQLNGWLSRHWGKCCILKLTPGTTTARADIANFLRALESTAVTNSLPQCRALLLHRALPPSFTTSTSQHLLKLRSCCSCSPSLPSPFHPSPASLHCCACIGVGLGLPVVLLCPPSAAC